MSGFIEIDARELGLLDERLARLADIDRAELLDLLGGMGAEQTKTRIADEKTSPDGAPWLPNRRGGSILYLEGNLRDSISHDVSGDETRWGSNLVYAAIHQFGGTIKPKSAGKLVFSIGNQTIFADHVDMPARPYLGLSDGNKTEIEEALNGWINERLAA